MAKSSPPVETAPHAAPAAPAEGGPETPMSIKDVVALLAKNSKGKGMVTYDQLNALLPDAMNDPEQLDQILEQLDARGIELVEEIGTDDTDFGEEAGTTEGEEGAAPGTSRFEATPDAPENDEVELGEKIDDPVRMYLSQMGIWMDESKSSSTSTTMVQTGRLEVQMTGVMQSKILSGMTRHKTNSISRLGSKI